MICLSMRWLNFFSGAIMMACGLISLLFYRFWRRTGDLLFVSFSGGFLLLAVERIALIAFRVSTEDQSGIYWIRLAAFIFVLIGIVLKNRKVAPKETA